MKPLRRYIANYAASLHCYTANTGNNANVANGQQRHHHPILFFCQLYNLNFKFQFFIVNIRLSKDWCTKVQATEERKCKGRDLSNFSFTTICLWFGDYPKGLCLFAIYLPYLSSIYEKANCIAILWTVSPHSLGSCLFRGLWVTCLPHKGGASR